MRLKYTYKAPEDTYVKEFDSFDSFFSEKFGWMFKELFADGRDLPLDRLQLELSYPATIIIEVER